MSNRRVGALVVLPSFVVALSPAAATAQENPPCADVVGSCAEAVVVDATLQAGVRMPESVTEAIAFARANPAPVCEYRNVPLSFDPQLDVANTDGVPAGAIYYVRDCGGGAAYLWYQRSTGETNDPAVMALVGEAFAEIEPEAPQLVTSPPLGATMVTGFPMYLAVDDGSFETLTSEVSAGDLTVTATVTPVTTRFAPGDDVEPFVCDGTGSVWSPGARPGPDDCTHTYTHTPAHLRGEGAGEAYGLTSQVTYAASYVVEGPVFAGSYTLGEFDGPEAVVDIPVTERRAVRVDG